MPRKKSTIPPATRVRENQRRSRARRQELIDDLHHRLREYEEKKLQATLAMQLAARQIALENTQLRNLLASHRVSPEEIEEFLHGQEHIALRVPSNAVASGKVRSSTAAQVHEASRVTSSTDRILREAWGHEVGDGEQGDSWSTRKAEDQVVSETRGGELNKEVPRLRSPAQELKLVDSLQAQNSTGDKCGCDNSDQPSANDAEQNNMLPPVSDCFCPASPTSSLITGDDLMLKMSCETAASIISGMRGNGDQERARLQLGCEGGEHCNVKNIKVLQIMEMD